MSDAAGRASPSFERVCLGFAVAPATAAGPVIAFYLAAVLPYVSSETSTGLLMAPFGFGVLAGAFAYPITLVLAVPAYFLIRERIHLTPLRAALIGGAIGGLVAGGLISTVSPYLREGLLFRGHLSWLHLVAAGFASGALPGWVFWKLATWPERRGLAPRG